MVDGERVRGKVVPETARRLGIPAVERNAADCALRRIAWDEGTAHVRLSLVSDVSRQIMGVDLPDDGGWARLRGAGA